MRQSDRGTETWLEGQIKANDRFLFASGAGCAYCHVAETENSSLPKSMQAPKYYPTGIRPRWFEKARFSHEKHPETQVTCAECHAAGTSNKSSDVLMPKVQTCQRCHNTGVGARSDCVECHDYHFRTYGDRQATGSWPNN
jgi:predicted CXXCH cytochrome family protein